MERNFFENINEKKVFCILDDPVEQAKSVVIMAHGFHSSSAASSLKVFSSKIVAAGFSALRFDQPGCGRSEGEFIDSSFTDWVETIIYFAKKFLTQGCMVALFGNSMGATATVIAAGSQTLQNKIPCLLLWAPDPKSTVSVDPDQILKEGGMKYRGRFWLEARDANFFSCLQNYVGNIHLVYGEQDSVVDTQLQQKVIQVVQKNRPVMILQGQPHGHWPKDVLDSVIAKEIEFLKQNLR